MKPRTDLEELLVLESKPDPHYEVWTHVDPTTGNFLVQQIMRGSTSDHTWNYPFNHRGETDPFGSQPWDFPKAFVSALHKIAVKITVGNGAD